LKIFKYYEKSEIGMNNLKIKRKGRQSISQVPEKEWD
jgi:hypothetical protein